MVDFANRRKSDNVEIRGPEESQDLLQQAEIMDLLEMLSQATGPARLTRFLTNQGDFFDPRIQKVPQEGLKELALARNFLREALADNGDPISQRALPSEQAQMFEGVDILEDLLSLFASTGREALLAPEERKEEAFRSADAKRVKVEDSIRLLVEALQSKSSLADGFLFDE